MNKIKQTRSTLSIVAILLVLFSTAVFPAEAFTDPPTLDLTTSSHIAGATDAVYTFHSENPDPLTAVLFDVPIPVGYLINSAYLTTTPGIIVMTGVYGNIGGPVMGNLRLETTAAPGWFDIWAEQLIPLFPWVKIGTVQIIPPTLTTPGNIGGALGPLNSGEYADLTFIAGFFINPSTPGIYTWGPSTATDAAGNIATMNPRIGFTNQVAIVSPVGGEIAPITTLALLPWIVLIVVAIALGYTITRRKPLH
ncbi:MAG: hypothetical protein ACFFCW_33270 [Candidatus Hodarchaeota archaeon]